MTIEVIDIKYKLEEADDKIWLMKEQILANLPTSVTLSITDIKSFYKNKKKYIKDQLSQHCEWEIVSFNWRMLSKM